MTIEMSRRTVLMAPALLTVAVGTHATAQTDDTQRRRSKILVAYFSRSGNTRVVAGTLQRNLAADLVEIQPAQAYPADYEQAVEQARQERDRGYEPPLAAKVDEISSYDTVFVGFPIWGETAPPVIRSFLRAHDLSGKTLRPFITHGGYGTGSSLAVLADHARGARIEPPFVLEADQERRTLQNVRRWLVDIEQRN